MFRLVERFLFFFPAAALGSVFEEQFPQIRFFRPRRALWFKAEIVAVLDGHALCRPRMLPNRLQFVGT